MASKNAIGRRRFLQLGAAGGVGLAAGCATPSATASGRTREPTSPRGSRRRPRNVIFMASDGMSTGTLTLADMMIRERTGRPSSWVRLWEAPGVRRAMCSTHAADSWVTDSAAAASAWGIGRKVNNGAVNFTPDGERPAPLLVTARERGLATGLVTTTRLTHATPAGFIANVPSRGLEASIAEQMMDRGFDVALGGGEKHFPESTLGRREGVEIVRTREELLATDGSAPLLGLFNGDHMSYELDRPESEPTLAEMTRVALDRLSRSPDGFIVQIEGGRVDHAAHNNDACALVADQIAFDDAIGVAAAFTTARDDTLLIVTTDHANANPGLTLYKNQGNAGLERLAGARRSFDWILEQTRGAGSPDAVMQVLPLLVAQATGVELRDADRAWLYRHLVDRERADGFLAASGFGPVLGAVLANSLGVAFVSPNHTADHVEVTACGPGSERLAPMVDNTDLHALVVDALELRRVPVGA